MIGSEIKLPEEVANGHIVAKRTLLNNVLRKIVNWIGHILRKYCLLHDATEGLMMKVKGVGRRIRI